jgi:hypothetical protein
MRNSPNTIRMIPSRRMRWAGHVARMEEKRNAYRILVGKPEGNRPLGRPRRRGVNNIKIDLREIGCEWYGLGQTVSGLGPLEGSCEHGEEPLGFIKCWKVLEQLHN